MDLELVARLEAERTERLKQAAQKLLEANDPAGAAQHLAWVETTDKVLSFAPKSHTVQWSLIGIFFGCLCLLGLSWTIHIPSTQLAVEVAADNIALTLDAPYRPYQALTAKKLIVNQIAAFSAPGVSGLIAPTPENAGTLAIEGDLTLTAFELPANAVVELTRRGDELRAFIKNAQMKLGVQAARATVTLATADGKVTGTTLDAEIPESFMLTTLPVTAAAVELRLTGLSNWRLRGMDIQALGFFEEYPPDSGQFQSVIRAGKILLRQTGQEHEMMPGDVLRLRDLRSRRVEIAPQEDHLLMLFEGVAGEITLGAQDVALNLTPTWFEYMRDQKPLAAFWTAMIFLIGVAWKIRSVIMA